jgi:thiosulfate reductase / polysulfide reductase chain A
MTKKRHINNQAADKRDEDIGRRAAVKAGLLATIGVASGAVFHGLTKAAGAAEASGSAFGPITDGKVDPLVGELSQADVDGYTGRTGAKRVGVASTCMQCIAACGIIGYRENGRIVKIEGNPHCPNNRGMICAKGQAGMNQVYDPDRLLYPLVRTGRRGEGKWKRVSMNKALDLLAFGGTIAGRKVEGLKSIYESDKPEEFMFHYGRSRIKNAMNHFQKTAFGSATQGNHTSICETAKWLGNELTMGKHYDVNDAAHSKYILIFGANVLEAHTSHSYLAQRLIEAKAAGAKIVTFDVRLSNTAAKSDEWIPILPGTDLAVILAMTNVLLNETVAGNVLYDEAFLTKWSNVTIDELKAHYARYTPEWAEGESGVPAATIRRLALGFGSHKPSTIITYRGFVGHYNGAQAEWAAKTLDALAGNFNVKGGTTTKQGGKCKDGYTDKAAKENPEAKRKAAKFKISDGEDLHMPTHHSCQWIYEMIAEGSHGRPKIYMTYVYNGAYTTGDCQRNREVLCNEEYIPFIVAVDVAMSETAACADLILPDATYLERWAMESAASYAQKKFVQIRQPVAKPLGESMDMQDIFIQLARRIGGNIDKLHPYVTSEQYVETGVKLQADDNERSGKTFYDSNDQPLTSDAWEYFKRYGVLLQGNKPSYNTHEKTVSAEGKTLDAKTGVVWDTHKAHVPDEDVAAKGYTGSKSAYKGYVGQQIDGKTYAGFKPDKFNKSGLFEIRSGFMPGAADKVMADIKDFLTPEEAPWVAEHLKSGLPSWVPVPEHRTRTKEQLVMISFKVNVQIHSRSQNCKWLQEVYHTNPAWLNPVTAKKMLGMDIKEGDLIRIKSEMPDLPWRKDKGSTTVNTITARVHLTEAIHPEAIAVSYHCGHWAYGRYACGNPIETANTGAEPDGENIWWQEGRGAVEDPTQWSEIAGVHPNWIIPNTPARVSGQFRSNDTIVSIAKA